MLVRNLSIVLHRAVHAHALVVLEGPRGSGKTTLLKGEFPRRLYLTLDDPADRQAARRDPAAFIARLRTAAIIDDVHRAPELVTYLTGNPVSTPLLVASPRKLSLPYTTLRLYHPTLAELERRPPLALEMLGHFVPRVEARLRAYEAWPRDNGLLERDVRELAGVQDLDRFDQFARIGLQHSGQILDQQRLADLAGISRTTVVRWLAVLDASFLTFRVPPCDYALGRRTIRSPKLHFTESESFESRVISEIYRNAAHTGALPDLRYWRDSNGSEIALVLQLAGVPPVAVAVAESPNPGDDARLHRWMKLAGTQSAAVISLRARDQTRGPILRYTLDQL